MTFKQQFTSHLAGPGAISTFYSHPVDHEWKESRGSSCRDLVLPICGISGCGIWLLSAGHGHSPGLHACPNESDTFEVCPSFLTCSMFLLISFQGAGRAEGLSFVEIMVRRRSPSFHSSPASHRYRSPDIAFGSVECITPAGKASIIGI